MAILPSESRVKPAFNSAGSDRSSDNIADKFKILILKFIRTLARIRTRHPRIYAARAAHNREHQTRVP
eukprot:1393303-Amorphochlora_amoeboformis.AAC.1